MEGPLNPWPGIGPELPSPHPAHPPALGSQGGAGAVVEPAQGREVLGAHLHICQEVDGLWQRHQAVLVQHQLPQLGAPVGQ